MIFVCVQTGKQAMTFYCLFTKFVININDGTGGGCKPQSSDPTL